MIPIQWSARAKKDFDSIDAYLRSEAGSNVADSQGELLLSRLQQLQDFPDLGRPAKRLICRKLVVTGSPYTIYYRNSNDSIQVLAVRHGSRKPLKRLSRS